MFANQEDDEEKTPPIFKTKKTNLPKKKSHPSEVSDKDFNEAKVKIKETLQTELDLEIISKDEY